MAVVQKTITGYWSTTILKTTALLKRFSVILSFWIFQQYCQMSLECFGRNIESVYLPLHVQLNYSGEPKTSFHSWMGANQLICYFLTLTNCITQITFFLFVARANQLACFSNMSLCRGSTGNNLYNPTQVGVWFVYILSFPDPTYGITLVCYCCSKNQLVFLDDCVNHHLQMFDWIVFYAYNMANVFKVVLKQGVLFSQWGGRGGDLCSVFTKLTSCNKMFEVLVQLKVKSREV